MSDCQYTSVSAPLWSCVGSAILARPKSQICAGKGCLGGQKTTQSWITNVDLQITSGVQEDVAGLEVSVQHIGRVDVLEASQDLVEEVADVVPPQALVLSNLCRSVSISVCTM